MHAQGTTGSLAFAAFDAGLDVWLGTTRNNPPRRNIFYPNRADHRYWQFSCDEIALRDLGAQVRGLCGGGSGSWCAVVDVLGAPWRCAVL